MNAPASHPRPYGAAGRAAAQAAETLALTLWAEAAERPVRAIEALAALVVNRARMAATDEAARLRFAPGASSARRLAAPPGPRLPGAVPLLLLEPAPPASRDPGRSSGR